MRRHIEPVRCNALFYGRRAARATKDDARGVGARAAVCVVVTVFDSSSRHTAPRAPPSTPRRARARRSTPTLAFGAFVAMTTRADVEAAALKAMVDTRACVPRDVPRLAAPPSALAFATEYLAKNMPFVCAHATDDWRAHAAWSSVDKVAERARASGSSVIRVNVAPHGRGDAAVYYTGTRVVGLDDDVDVVFDGGDDDGGGEGTWLFVEPRAVDVDVDDFLRSLENGVAVDERIPHYRAYASMQNDNLRTDPALRAMYEEDVGEAPAFATEAFAGAQPDAVNLWIGNDGSQTAYHKDYYENFYTVVTGVKIFTLRPPCDYAMMRYTPCVPAKFEIVDDEPKPRWRVRCASLAEPRVSWSVVDVDSHNHPVYESGEERMTYAAFAGTSPPPAYEVEVRAGETLYLPSMWFHRVRQRGFTVAVNHWYDMHFGDRFASANFMREVCESIE